MKCEKTKKNGWEVEKEKGSQWKGKKGKFREGKEEGSIREHSRKDLLRVTYVLDI